MKSIRNFLLFIVLFALITLAALWAFTRYAQPDFFKKFAIKQISALTHQDSRIDGDIQWRIFPQPGLQVTDVHIGDVKNQETDYALYVKDLVFHLQLRPLLHGQLIFDKLMLSDFTLRLNFNKLNNTPAKAEQKSTVAVKPQTSPPATPSSSSSFSFSPRIALKSISLTDGNILIQQKNETLALKKVRIETELPENTETQFPIQIKAELEKQTPAFPVKSTAVFKGLVTLPPAKELSTHIDKLKLNGQLLLQNLKAGNYEITAANAHLYFNNGKLELNPLTLTIYQGESVGELTYTLKDNKLSLNQIATAVEAESFFQNIFNIKPSRVSGLLDFSMQADAFLNQEDWLATAKANGSFTIKNGEIAYINIPEVTEQATETIMALASKNMNNLQQVIEKLKPWSLSGFDGSTPFQLLSFQYQADGNGNLHYNILLETKKLHLKGEGDLNLINHKIKAQLVAHISTQNQSIQKLEHELGDGFPMIISGTLENPIITPDKPIIRKALSSIPLPKEVTKPLGEIQQHIHTIKMLKKAVSPISE